MSETLVTHLEDRGVIAVTGKDQRTFLQGIVSNDMNKVSDTQAGYGAFLTPQGKYLFDFFMVMQGETLLIETERKRIPDFVKRLTMYKLRADVVLEDVSDSFRVYVAFGAGAAEAFALNDERGSASGYSDGIAFVDPRLSETGVRAILPADTALPEGVTSSDGDTYDRHRLALGLPDGSRDLVIEKSTLMESGFDELNGIDWQKGCYMGQEVTARMKHRGLTKKRLLPVSIVGDAPEAGADVMMGDRTVGEMRTTNGDLGLAIIRLDALEAGEPMTAGSASIQPNKPDWASF